MICAVSIASFHAVASAMSQMGISIFSPLLSYKPIIARCRAMCQVGKEEISGKSGNTPMASTRSCCGGVAGLGVILCFVVFGIRTSSEKQYHFRQHAYENALQTRQ